MIEKTVSVAGNPLSMLEIQPWLEEKPLLSAPAGYINSPSNHIAYTYASTSNMTVAIQMQE